MKLVDISENCYAHLMKDTVYLYVNNEFTETFYINDIGTVPDLSNIRIFGCRVEYKINKYQTKLSPKTRHGIFIGYQESNYAYRVWDSQLKKVIISRDVKFFENSITVNNNLATNNQSNTSINKEEFTTIPLPPFQFTNSQKSNKNFK